MSDNNNTVNSKLYDVEQIGIILKKDINKLSKRFDLVFAKRILFSTLTFVDDDGKTIERLIIESIIYADRIIEDDDMDKIRKPIIDGDNELLKEILKSINDLRDDMNQKFAEVDKKFEELETRIMNHISEEFKKHIEEYHS